MTRPTSWSVDEIVRLLAQRKRLANPASIRRAASQELRLSRGEEEPPNNPLLLHEVSQERPRTREMTSTAMSLADPRLSWRSDYGAIRRAGSSTMGLFRPVEPFRFVWELTQALPGPRNAEDRLIGRTSVETEVAFYRVNTKGPSLQGPPPYSPGWTRTNNPPVNSRMLCQLSYRGTALAARKCSRAWRATPLSARITPSVPVDDLEAQLRLVAPDFRRELVRRDLLLPLVRRVPFVLRRLVPLELPLWVELLGV